MQTDPLIDKFYEACYQGNIEKMKETVKEMKEDVLIRYLSENATCYLSLADCPEGLEYFFSLIPDITIHDYLEVVKTNIESVCYHRKFKTLKYWLEDTPLKESLEKDMSKSLFYSLVRGCYTSCLLGDVNFIEYLTNNKHFAKHFNSTKEINNLLNNAARNDHVELVERLLDKYSANSHILINSLLKEAHTCHAHKTVDYLLYTKNIAFTDKTKKYFINHTKITELFIQRDSKKNFYNGLEKDLDIKNSLEETSQNSRKLKM